MGGELGWALRAALGRGQRELHIWAGFHGSGDDVLLPKRCLLIAHIPLAVAHSCREKTCWFYHIIIGTQASWIFQLEVPGWNWTTTQLPWPLKVHSENLRRDKGQRNCGAQNVTW